ncbi:MAG: aminotransferase class I/II-fold pyridoxal phosphate-dependent enzyme [Gemmatimonadales bacterium]|nr:aminotransferase class I/II-fold pyridoxal phosphate-dependent enzyme [Gemmatimonadales bacterium]
MPLTRRDFLRGLGAGGAALAARPALGARGLEAARGLDLPRDTPIPAIRLDSNENPNGPAPAAIEAIKRSLGEASRYPDNPEDLLREALAKAHGVAPEWVLLGCGSTEILRVAVMAFGSADRPLVTAAPTFEEPVRIARTLGVPVKEIPVDRAMGLDLDAMARAAAPGAGIIFVCNPNNPTATVHGARAIDDFVVAVRRSAPKAVILLDEAYHEYVEDPSYASAIPMLKNDARVMVARTFSKVHGLAGIRAGYAIAQPETIAAMRPYRLPSGISAAAGAAAVATLNAPAHTREEQRKNRETKAFTRAFFEGLGYTVGPSETNFIMADIRRDSRAFKAACLTDGVAIGRQFPPFLTHARISIGTMDEMRRATRVFRKHLASA